MQKKWKAHVILYDEGMQWLYKILIGFADQFVFGMSIHTT